MTSVSSFCAAGHDAAVFGRTERGCPQCNRDAARAYMAERRRENKGKVFAPETPEELERFWSKVDKADCWTWTGAQNGRGYGIVTVRSVNLLTHRAAYFMRYGKHDPGLELDHLCRNRICCNPDHLEPVTHTENMRRSPIATKTDRNQCSRGHDDWVTYPSRPEARHCRSCNIERKLLRPRVKSR